MSGQGQTRLPFDRANASAAQLALAMTPVSERKSETHELLPTAAAEAVTLPDWGPPFRLRSHHHQSLDRGAIGEDAAFASVAAPRAAQG